MKNLDQISVASPCAEPWDRMRGDDQVRHCERCDKNVYNISTMKLADIAELVERKEGKLCVRFYRRADGTILTDDCPVGVRAAFRRKLALVAALLAGAFAWFAGLFGRSPCGIGPGLWVAGGMRPPPPERPGPYQLPPKFMAPPVEFKVKAIAPAGATIEFQGKDYVVKPGQWVPSEENPAFLVKDVTADSVQIHDAKQKCLVRKFLK